MSTPPVEKDWVTASGLRAVINHCRYSSGHWHRCGYVGVPAGAMFYGAGYSEPLVQIPCDEVQAIPLGKKGVLLAITAGVNAAPGDTLRRSLDVVIDVHGGITYSGGSEQYPAPSDGLWWFGYDTGHCDDSEDGGQPLDYCIAECESMAQQLLELEARCRRAAA